MLDRAAAVAAAKARKAAALARARARVAADAWMTSDSSLPIVDRRDSRVSLLLLKRMWRVAKPYWTNRENWRMWLLAIALLASIPVTSYVLFRTAYLTADMTNAIVAKREAQFYDLLWLTTMIGLATFGVSTLSQYLTSRLVNNWTRWMTSWMIERYLAHRTYYDIALREDLDNPDQRIQADLPPLITMLANIPERLLNQVISGITGGIIIASISPTLTIFVVIYTIVSTVVMIVCYSPATRFNYQATVAGADLRYGILHVRDNAETVAFYKGEAHEQAQIRTRIGRSINAQKRVLLYNFVMNGVNQMVGLVWELAPFFLVTPLFFAGKIEYGSIAMATTGAMNMRSALTLLNNFLPSIALNAPNAVRLAQIVERMDQVGAAQHVEAANLISVRPGPAIRLERVSLETPNGEQQLFRDLDFAIPPGSALVIIGQTGVGKSSLLRAIAGLWRRGSGTIVAPPIEDCLFLPQRPYMILGDLRSQLLYPRGRRDVDDAELQRILERVRLPELLDKNGGLGAVRDWGKVLSLGEQQRVAFARILVSGAKVVFLDEATSAVDIATEAALYDILRDEGVTYVSVGHRETILAFHERALELFPGGGWKIVPVAALRQKEVESSGTDSAYVLSPGK